MSRVYSTVISSFLLAVLFAGCASVEATKAYYLSYTTDVYPPKPKDQPIPILGKYPDRPYKVIGRLAFRSDLGWKFMRESMVYNARENGADAVILKAANSEEQTRYTEVPPRTDWVPVPGPVIVQKQGNKTYYQNFPTYIPVFQPGYVRRWVDVIVGIDSEMIVFRRKE